MGVPQTYLTTNTKGDHMKKDQAGFIKLSRTYFDHPFFKEKREYSRAEAWLDLIQMCAYGDNNQMLLKGRLIVWGRGQTVASVRHLQQRWGWKSLDKVFSFLELLRNQQMIQTDTDQGIGRITLCKYADYNDSPNADRTQKRTDRKSQDERKSERSTDCKEDSYEDVPNAERTQPRTLAEQSPNNIKEYKEEERIKEREARAQKFYDSLLPFLETYKPEMLRAFYSYWSEWNKSTTKMRWELQATWETKKRLAKWASRDNDFAPAGPQVSKQGITAKISIKK